MGEIHKIGVEKDPSLDEIVDGKHIYKPEETPEWVGSSRTAYYLLDNLQGFTEAILQDDDNSLRLLVVLHLATDKSHANLKVFGRYEGISSDGKGLLYQFLHKREPVENELARFYTGAYQIATQDGWLKREVRDGECSHLSSVPVHP